jgi:DNA-directed RNA polymerase specialized sigma24 family protein
MEAMMSDKPSDDEIVRARGFGPPVPREPASWTTDYELEKAKRDLADQIATAKDEGKLQARRAVVNNMFLQKYSVEEISTITGIPADEVRRLGSDS